MAQAPRAAAPVVAHRSVRHGLSPVTRPCPPTPVAASTTDQAGWGQMLRSRSRSRDDREPRRRRRTSRQRASYPEEVDSADLAVSKPAITSSVRRERQQQNVLTGSTRGQTIPLLPGPETPTSRVPDAVRRQRLAPTPKSERRPCSSRRHRATPPTAPRRQRHRRLHAGHARPRRGRGDQWRTSISRFDHLKRPSSAPTPEDVFSPRGDGTVDGTHSKEAARSLAGRLHRPGHRQERHRPPWPSRRRTRSRRGTLAGRRPNSRRGPIRDRGVRGGHRVMGAAYLALKARLPGG